MKKSLIITFLVYICYHAAAQEFICLKDGSSTKEKPASLSERTIENTDKEIVTTYNFNYPQTLQYYQDALDIADAIGSTCSQEG